MNTKELRELDTWIEKVIFGRNYVEWGDCFGGISWDSDKMPPRYYTTDPAASMEVLKKCAEKVCVKIRKQDSGDWNVWQNQCCSEMEEDKNNPDCYAPTLELAIAKFARKIFTKP